jgi:fructose-1,6-bisphosphatase/inositol monophosphatase family enzyme
MKHLQHLIVDRMLEAATLLSRPLLHIEALKKDHWSKAGDPGFGGIVTRWDQFIQDFIAGSVLAHFPDVTVLGEESTGLFNSDGIQSAVSLIIDPIDGTEWFAKGEDEFSILVSLMKDATVIWSAGVFPKKDRMWICDEGCVRFKVISDRTDVARHVFPPTHPKVIAAHYRLGRGAFRPVYDRLVDQGYRILMNGEGFGTNLSAAEKLINGDISAFIAPKMSVVDGFPVARLVQSAGGTVQFFDPNMDGDTWIQAPDWSFYDFGEDVGKRTRFIAAFSFDQIEEIRKSLQEPQPHCR